MRKIFSIAVDFISGSRTPPPKPSDNSTDALIANVDRNTLCTAAQPMDSLEEKYIVPLIEHNRFIKSNYRSVTNKTLPTIK